MASAFAKDEESEDIDTEWVLGDEFQLVKLYSSRRCSSSRDRAKTPRLMSYISYNLCCMPIPYAT